MCTIFIHILYIYIHPYFIPLYSFVVMRTEIVKFFKNYAKNTVFVDYYYSHLL